MTITILDGGMGQELIARAGKATGAWSNQALFDNPRLVREVHDDFFASGAQVATTNTYSVLPDRFAALGMEDRLEEFAVIACTLAVESRDAAGGGLVAGSMGPLGFSYRPDKAPPAEEAAEIYARLAQIHAPFVDLHMPETMASVDQAKGALMGTSVTGKPTWLAVTVDDADGTKLRSGEPLVDLLPILQEFQPDALLLNCSAPEAISKGLGSIPNYGGRIGAYANGFMNIAEAFSEIGDTVDALDTRTDLDPKAYAKFAHEWVRKGASLVGGCCEVSPAHIRELKQTLQS